MASHDISYEYDAAGNRTRMIDNLTGEETTYTYDRRHQLLNMVDSSGTTTFTYDADGNRTRKETPTELTEYTWDAENHLTDIQTINDEIHFSYNSDGQRTKKESNAGTVSYLYDFNHLLQEMDGDDQTEKLYTFTDDQWGDLVSEYGEEDGSLYHQYDAQWSTQALLDEDQSVTDRYKYRAFGLQDHAAGSSKNPHTFVGKQGYYRDSELDLYMLGMGHGDGRGGRFYDPELGRFISEDPLRYAAGDQNLYRYVKNNPINAIDPSGLVGTIVSAEPPEPGQWRTGPMKISLVRDNNATTRSAFVGRVSSYDWENEGANAIQRRVPHTTVKSVGQRFEESGLLEGSFSSFVSGLVVGGLRQLQEETVLEGLRLTVRRSELQTAVSSGELSFSSSQSQIDDWFLRKHGKDRVPNACPLREYLTRIACNIFGVITYPVLKLSGSDFCSKLGEIGEDISDFVKQLVRKGVSGIGKIANLFMRGLKDGLGRFCNAVGGSDSNSCIFPVPQCRCLVQRVMEGVKQWIGESGFSITDAHIVIQNFLKTGSVGKVVRYMLDLFGLGWNSLLNMLSTAIPQMPLVMKAVEFINKGLQKADEAGGLLEWFKDLQADAQQALGEVRAVLTGGPDKLFTLLSDVVEDLGKTFLVKALKKAIAWATPQSALVQAGITLYRGVRFVIEKMKTIKELFDGVKSMFKLAFGAASDQATVVIEIGRRFRDTMQSAIAPILGGLAYVLLDGVNIPKKIGEALDGIRAKLQKPIRKLLEALAKPANALLEKFTRNGALQPQRQGTSTAEKTRGRSFGLQVRKKGKSANIVLSASPEGDLIELIDAYRRRNNGKISQCLEDVYTAATESKKVWDARIAATEALSQKKPKKLKRSEKPAPLSSADKSNANLAAGKDKSGTRAIIESTDDALLDAAKKCPEIFCLGATKSGALPPCPNQLEFTPTTEQVNVSYLGEPVNRVTKVSAVIVSAGNARTNFSTGFPAWWAKFTSKNPISGLGWRKGHLVGSQFGGQADADNLAPQTFKVNNSVVQKCDNRIKEALACRCVTFIITVNYDPGQDPLRPVSFRIEAGNGHGFELDVTIENVPNPAVPQQCEA